MVEKEKIRHRRTINRAQLRFNDKNKLPMTKTTSSTNFQKTNTQQNAPKESTLRAILDFAATYRFQQSSIEIEYLLN